MPSFSYYYRSNRLLTITVYVYNNSSNIEAQLRGQEDLSALRIETADCSKWNSSSSIAVFVLGVL